MRFGGFTYFSQKRQLSWLFRCRRHSNGFTLLISQCHLFFVIQKIFGTFSMGSMMCGLVLYKQCPSSALSMHTSFLPPSPRRGEGSCSNLSHDWNSECRPLTSKLGLSPCHLYLTCLPNPLPLQWSKYSS